MKGISRIIIRLFPFFVNIYYMNYAIIAAGDGSRLAKEGVESPKPLVEINGEKMIDRLIRIFSENNADTVYIIVNEYMKDVALHIRSTHYPVRVELVIETTPSSMHSFYELSKIIPDDKFCLTTVDTIFKESEFKEYISAFLSKNEALFAVTDYIEDESPLYVATDLRMKITGFLDNPRSDVKYISGGIYCLLPESKSVLEKAINSGQHRMRNYQRSLIENGVEIKAYPFSKIIDVDHAADIKAAEEFLQNK